METQICFKYTKEGGEMNKIIIYLGAVINLLALYLAIKGDILGLCLTFFGCGIMLLGSVLGGVLFFSPSYSK